MTRQIINYWFGLGWTVGCSVEVKLHQYWVPGGDNFFRIMTQQIINYWVGLGWTVGCSVEVKLHEYLEGIIFSPS